MKTRKQVQGEVGIHPLFCVFCSQSQLLCVSVSEKQDQRGTEPSGLLPGHLRRKDSIRFS